jgi:flavodoxin
MKNKIKRGVEYHEHCVTYKDHAAAMSELESQLKEQCHINAISAERELKLQKDLEAVTATIKGQHKLNDEAYAKINALTELVKLVKNKLVLCFALSDDKTIELIVRETNAKIIDELKKIGEV